MLLGEPSDNYRTFILAILVPYNHENVYLRPYPNRSALLNLLIDLLLVWHRERSLKTKSVIKEYDEIRYYTAKITYQTVSPSAPSNV